MGFVPTGHRSIKSRHLNQAGDNHNYLVQTRDCTTQRWQSQLPSRETWWHHTVEKITTT